MKRTPSSRRSTVLQCETDSALQSGASAPLGATIAANGVNFSMYSKHAVGMTTGQLMRVDGGILTGWGEDRRSVVRKRMADMKASHAAVK